MKAPMPEPLGGSGIGAINLIVIRRIVNAFCVQAGDLFIEPFFPYQIKKLCFPE